MFSIGFTELLLIAVVTLLVVGPEKLPETVRAITIQLSRLKRFWQNAKRDVEREVGMDEIRREIHNTEVMEHLKRAEKMNFKNLSEEYQGDTGVSQAAQKGKAPASKNQAAEKSDTPSPDTENENSIHERRPESDAD